MLSRWPEFQFPMPLARQSWDPDTSQRHLRDWIIPRPVLLFFIWNEKKERYNHPADYRKDFIQLQNSFTAQRLSLFKTNIIRRLLFGKQSPKQEIRAIDENQFATTSYTSHAGGASKRNILLRGFKKKHFCLFSWKRDCLDFHFTKILGNSKRIQKISKIELSRFRILLFW